MAEDLAIETVPQARRRADRPRVSFVFYQFCPLQAARIATVAQELDIQVVEVVQTSAHYRWSAPEVHGAIRFESLFDEPVGERAEERAVTRALEAFRPEVVIALGYYRRFALAAIRHAHRHRLPLVMVSDSTRIEASRNPLRTLAKRALAGAASAGFVAGAAQEAALRDIARPGMRIAQGYDVVDNEAIAAAAARARPASEPAPFLCVARLVRQKNHRVLLEAMARFVREVPGSTRELHLAGYGPMEVEIRAEIDRLGLGERVRLLGAVPYDEMPGRYAGAAALVLPSLSEPWGLVVNEAMAAGLPVIVSDRCGCAPDLVREGEAGFIFDPTDPAELAGRLAALDADAGLRARMGEAGRRVVADWGLERYRAGFLDALDAARAAKVPGWRRGLATLAAQALRLRRDKVRGFA